MGFIQQVLLINMADLDPYNVNELAIKCKSKMDVYDVILNDCDVYLPPIQFANAEYIRAVISGKILVSLTLFTNTFLACKQKCC